jgi:hypothetical protein
MNDTPTPITASHAGSQEAEQALPSAVFPVRETALAFRLGIPRDTVRRVRGDALQQGVHWQLVSGRIQYAENAAEVVASALQITLGPEPAIQPAGVTTEVLTVTSAPRHTNRSGRRYHFPNPRVIMAQRATGERVTVQVASSENFRPFLRSGEPMTIKAYNDGRGWVIHGRSPRGPGMW